LRLRTGLAVIRKVLLGELPLALAAVGVGAVGGAVLRGGMGLPAKRELVGKAGRAIGSKSRHVAREGSHKRRQGGRMVRARPRRSVSSKAGVVWRQKQAVRTGKRQNRLCNQQSGILREAGRDVSSRDSRHALAEPRPDKAAAVALSTSANKQSVFNPTCAFRLAHFLPTILPPLSPTAPSSSPSSVRSRTTLLRLRSKSILPSIDYSIV
jgi:hypothetical protein